MSELQAALLMVILVAVGALSFMWFGHQRGRYPNWLRRMGMGISLMTIFAGPALYLSRPYVTEWYSSAQRSVRTLLGVEEPKPGRRMHRTMRQP